MKAREQPGAEHTEESSVAELAHQASGSPTGATATGPLMMPGALVGFWFALGAAPVVLLLVLVGTGIPLALHYVSGVPASAESIARLHSEVPYGWYARAIHHWAAALLGVMTVLHLLRVALGAAFRAERSRSWVLGVGLLALVLVAALTGEILPGDSHGYWTLRMAQQAFRGVPWLGEPVARWLFGAGLPDAAMLARVATVHVLVVPALMALLTLVHLGRVRQAGIAGVATRESERGGARLVPYWRVELAAACLLLALLNVLAAASPPGVGLAADPLVAPARMVPSWVGSAAAGWFDRVPQPAAQLVALGLGALLLAWPWLDAWAGRAGRAWLASPWWIVAGVVGVVGLGLGRVLGVG